MKQVGHSGSRWVLVVAFSSLTFATQSAAAASNCFRVYDSGGNLKYEGRQAPVDIRDTDSESWTKLRLRGEQLVWHTKKKCDGDAQHVVGSQLGRDADAKGTAAVILSRVPQFGGR